MDRIAEIILRSFLQIWCLMTFSVKTLEYDSLQNAYQFHQRVELKKANNIYPVTLTVKKNFCSCSITSKKKKAVNSSPKTLHTISCFKAEFSSPNFFINQMRSSFRYDWTRISAFSKILTYFSDKGGRVGLFGRPGGKY